VCSRRSTGSGSTGSCRCSGSCSRRLGVHVPPRQRASVPGPEELAGLLRAAGFEDVRWKTFAGGHRRAAHRGRLVSLATIRETPGLDAYLENLEERLAASVAGHLDSSRRSAGRRSRPVESGCGRCSCSWRRTREAPLAAGVAVELVHMATLVPRRRDRPRRAIAAAVSRPGRATARSRARGRATTCSRERSPSWPRPDDRRAVRRSRTRRWRLPAARRSSARRHTTPTRASTPTSRAAR
jgi:hypothetical protein